MCNTSTCKLADFGCSLNRDQLAQLAEERRTSKRKKDFLVGTFGYVAPEFIRGSLPTAKSDVFSLGVVIWQVLAKQSSPFPGMTGDAILYQVRSRSLLVIRKFPSEFLVSLGHLTPKMEALLRCGGGMCSNLDTVTSPPPLF